MRNDPISMGCHKVVDPSAGYYKASKMCCGRPTTVRCPFCMLPLCEKHTGECSNKGCDGKLQIANRRTGLEVAPFNPDTTRAEDRAVGGARELPRRLMPAPAPLDSVLHYPVLGTVKVVAVSIPLRDSRAEIKAKVDKDAKIKATRVAVPARPRSATPPPRRAASPQPAAGGPVAACSRAASIGEGVSDMLRDALKAHEEMEGTSYDPIDVGTPVKEVGKPECTEEEMFP